MLLTRISIISFLLILSSFCISQTEEKVDLLYSQYQQGKQAYNEGNYYKAIGLFEGVIDSEKESLKITDLSAKSYHKLAKSQRRLGRKIQGLESTNKGFEILQKLDKSTSEIAADLLGEKSNILRSLSRIAEAEKVFHKCSEIVKELYGEKSIGYATIKMTEGSIFADAGELRKAEISYLSAIETLHQSEGDKRSLFSKLYLNIGSIYRNMGHFEASQEYLEKALKLKQELYGEDNIRVARYYGSLGRTQKFLGNHKQALINKEKELQISLASNNLSAKRIGAVYNELASVYHSIGDSTRSIELLKLGIGKMEKAASLDDLYVCRSYGNMARYYEDYNNYEKALSIIDIAITRYEKNPFALAHELADFQRVKARILMAMDRGRDALQIIDQATKLMPSENKYDRIKLLHVKSKILINLSQNSDTVFLKQAYESTLESLEIVEELKFSPREKEIHRAFSEYTYNQYDLAVFVAYKLFDVTGNKDYLLKAWQLSDKSKASLLWKDMKDKEAIESGIISQEIISARRILMDEIQVLNSAIQGEDNEMSVDSLRKELDKKQSAFYSNTRELEHSNPIYYERKFNNPAPNLQLVQNTLQDKSVILHYHTFQHEILIFTISKDNISSNLIEVPRDLENIIQSLHHFSINEGNQLEYKKQLEILYELLIKPVENQLVEKNQLIIIPHNYLSYLAFGSLVKKSSETDFRKLPYLIKKYSIQYAWSTDLWMNMKANNSKSKNPYSGYAPGFKDSLLKSGNSYRNVQMELPFSLQEVSVGREIFNGIIYTNEQASKAHFIQNAPESNIFHLATHGIMDTKNPNESGILFSGTQDSSFLSASEIYSMSFNTDLAVMTACNTGNGPLDKGEGIMSLGRAFFQSGCSSILSSIWLANDESTSKIISLFYKYSAEGLSKDFALQKAKIQYLNETDALTAHPHFWANLTTMGDMQSLKPRSSISSFYYVGIFLLAFCVFGLFMYSKK